MAAGMARGLRKKLRWGAAMTKGNGTTAVADKDMHELYTTNIGVSKNTVVCWN